MSANLATCTATAESPSVQSILWKAEFTVLYILSGLFGIFILLFVTTCIGLRGRPRDFDSIMVDDADGFKDDRGYTSPGMR